MSRPSLKSLYVSSMRALRWLARASGLLRLLDAWARRSRTGVWVRSWLSVYDVEALVADDLPWWTFEAADRVERFLASRPGARVLEWGSGASTVWLARRGAAVTSIEHDPQWAERMRPLLDRTRDDGTGAVDLRVVPAVPAGTRLTRDVVASGKRGFEGWDFADYVAEADAVAGGLDLVVIDGRAREACLSRVLARVAPGGLIVVDNVDRCRYRRAVEQAGRVRELEVAWTRGRTPTLPYPTRTALLRTADA